MLGVHSGPKMGSLTQKCRSSWATEAQFELQIDEMRGMRDFEGSVEDDVNEVPVLRMHPS